MAIIETHKLTRKFGSATAVDSLDFSVEAVAVFTFNAVALLSSLWAIDLQYTSRYLAMVYHTMLRPA